MADAVMATVLGIGWTPLETDRWQDTCGDEYTISYDIGLDPWLVMQKWLREALTVLAWERASRCNDGKGLEAGADLTVVKKVLRGCDRRGAVEDRGILEVQRADWGNKRRFDTGHTSSCKRIDVWAAQV